MLWESQQGSTSIDNVLQRGWERVTALAIQNVGNFLCTDFVFD